MSPTRRGCSCSGDLAGAPAHARPEVPREDVQAILEYISDAFFAVDRDWRFVYVNRQAERLLQRQRADLLGRVVWEAFPEAVGSPFDEHYRRAVATDQTVTFEAYYAPLDIWVEVRAYPSPRGLSVYFRDATADRAAETALRESEERFRTLADNIAQLAWMADPQGNIFWYNRRWFEYTGTTLDEMRGWGWTAVHHPDHVDRVVARIRRAWETGEAWEDTFPLRGRDGRYHWFLSRALPIRDDQGQIVRWFGTNTDITELREAQAERERLLDAQYRATTERAAILEQLSEGVILADAEGRITFINDAAQRLHGVADLNVPIARYSEAFRLFTMDGDPYPPEQLPLARAVLRDETVVEAEWRIRRPDGTEVIAQGGARPMWDKDGRKLGAVLTVRDVTARHELDQQRSMFLAAVSHDLRNPLAAVKLAIQLLRRRLRGGGPVELDRVDAGLGQIEASAARQELMLEELADVTRLQMGRPLELRRAPTDLVALADQAVANHQAGTDRHDLRLDASVPRLVGTWDAARLRRVLDNLLGNAIKYSPDGGAVEVRVAREDDEAGSWGILSVSDHGLGIPAADLPRIFERFHRASNVGGIAGTGIGLAGSWQIVEQHGGRIEIRSQEGRGSTFTVRLPL